MTGLAGTLAPARYEDRYVAFVDILGFSSIVAESIGDPAVVDRVHLALAGISILADESRAAAVGFEVTSFSDSVVLSVLMSQAGLLHLIQMINQFSQDLLERGMLLRGAIARGHALHTRRVIFGPAMIEAYRLESTVSRHPRVILDSAVLVDAKSNARRNKLWRTMLARFVVEEHGDLPYLNPFASWPDSDSAWSAEAIEKLSSLRAIIVKGLDSNADSLSVVEKYKWLARRLDVFVASNRLAGHIPPIAAK